VLYIDPTDLKIGVEMKRGHVTLGNSKIALLKLDALVKEKQLDVAIFRVLHAPKSINKFISENKLKVILEEVGG
jgi:hypothetical protein